MRHTLTGISLATILLTPQLAFADFLSVYAGVEGWRVDPTATYGDNPQDSAAFNLSNETATGFYLGFEHPVPLIPNIKLRRDSLDTAGQATLTRNFTLNGTTYSSNSTVATTLELQQSDVILYWELLDLDLLSLDLGLNAKYIDLELTADDGVTVETENAKGWVPMAYAAAEISIPGLPLSVWTEGSYIGYGSDQFYDARAALKYTLVETLPMDLVLSLGYRTLVVDVEDLDGVFADIDFKGYYAGLEVRF
ncbi:MAG: outer membrane protein [Motiliproteus sp.]|jgi:outer membrane protein